MAFTYITLDAGDGYRYATGDVVASRIRAVPLVPMTNGTTVVASEVVLPLASNGTATKTLAATTDPATLPVGNAYRFIVEAGGRAVHSFVAAVPHNAGSTVDLDDLVELEAAPTLTPTVAAGLATLSAEVDELQAIFGDDGSSVGNDSTDDGAALLAAQAAVPAGGTVHLTPGKTYRITAALAWTRSIDGHGAVIHQATANQDALISTDTDDLVLRNVTIRGPVQGSPSGTGRGVVVARSVEPNISRTLLENVVVDSFGSHGIEMSNPIVSNLIGVNVKFCNGHGYYIHGVNGGAAGTSVTLTGCFAVSNRQAGYHFDTMTYCTLSGCAADQNGIGYEAIQCNSIAYVGCGAETQVDNSGSVAGYAGYGWKLNAGNGYSLTSCFTYDQAARSVWVTGSARAVSVTGFVELSPDAAATNCLVVDSGSDVTIEGLRNVEANSFNSAATISWLPAYTPGPQEASLLSWAYDPNTCSTNQLTVNGTLYLIKVPVRALHPISNVWWNAGTAGVTATAGQNWAGIYNSSGTLVASVGVDAQVTSANTPVNVALSASYTPTQPGFVWVGLLFNAATPPSLYRTNGATTAGNNAGILSASLYRFATNGTGQTTLPASITPGSNAIGSSIWVGVS